MPTSTGGIEQRVEYLEAENRRLNQAEIRRSKQFRIIVALAAVASLAGAAALNKPGEVSTTKLVLVDKDGKVRARLGTTAEGEPMFTLSDGEGNVGLMLAQQSDGTPSIALVDREHHVRLRVGLEPDGLTNLVMFGANGEDRLSLFRKPDGTSGLNLSDAKRLRLALVTDEDGNPSLGFYDKDTVRLGMRINEEGDPGLEIYDKLNTRISLGLFEKDSARLYIQGRGDRGGLRAQASPDGNSILQITGDGGKVQFQAPKPE